MDPTSPSPRYNRLTNGQKQKICAEAARQPHLSHAKLAAWTTKELTKGRRVPRSTVEVILKRKREYEDLSELDQSLKKLRSEAARADDHKLLVKIKAFKDWHPDGVVRGATVVTLARHLNTSGSECCYSKGWLHKFQVRTGLWFAVRHGEAGSVDMAAVNEGRAKLRRALANYDPSNIYNMDETAFFYERQSRGTLTLDKKAPGKKQNKNRLTMCVATNADGTDRRPLAFLGTAKVPVPLRGRDVRAELSVTCRGNAKGWMTSTVFADWLTEFNEDMKSQDCHVVLLIDNVSSHNTTEELEESLSHVRIERLPPNTTAILQPMDQAIIKSLKDQYAKAKLDGELRMFLNNEEYKRVNVYSAMKWCAEGWEHVTPSVIENPWLHTGLVSKMDIGFLMN